MVQCAGKSEHSISSTSFLFFYFRFSLWHEVSTGLLALRQLFAWTTTGMQTWVLSSAPCHRLSIIFVPLLGCSEGCPAGMYIARPCTPHSDLVCRGKVFSLVSSDKVYWINCEFVWGGLSVPSVRVWPSLSLGSYYAFRIFGVMTFLYVEWSSSMRCVSISLGKCCVKGGCELQPENRAFETHIGWRVELNYSIGHCLDSRG